LGFSVSLVGNMTAEEEEEEKEEGKGGGAEDVRAPDNL
jgi:hypothetical protein